MLEMWYGIEIIVQGLLAVIWLIAAMAATNMKHAAIHGGKLEWWRLLANVSVWAGMLVFAFWCALELAIWLTLGWVFAAGRIVVAMPILLVAGCAALAISVPRLFRIADMSNSSNQGIYIPAMLVPIQAMAGAAVFASIVVMFVVPVLPDWRDSAYSLLMFAVFAGLLWLYQRWSIKAIQRKKQSIVWRVAKSLGIAALVAAASLVWLVVGMQASKLPETMAMIHHETVDYGGGPVPATDSFCLPDGTESAAAGDWGGPISVAALTGPKEGVPDRKFTLEARKQMVALSSGTVVEAWTFNGEFPGPSLVVREGDLVEVNLINREIEAGVTLHWHGVDVPNAEDGVAGMTQNAVLPGETYTYRFQVEEQGTHWYHSHQVSSVQVKKGLFGALIILPEAGAEVEADNRDQQPEEWTLFAHELETEAGNVAVIGTQDTVGHRRIAPGKEVRLRLVNSSSVTKDFVLEGAPYRVVAIDGHNINEPGEITGKRLPVGGGGRYDVLFTMPDASVSLGLYDNGTAAGIVFSADGQGEFSMTDALEIFDPYSYGRPAQAGITEDESFDRHFTMILDMFYIGFYNGQATATWAINGKVFPHVPTFVVEEGDLVKTTVVNRTFADHPMHLHGHHIQVLSRNGKPIAGSPLILDTLLVRPGETYEYAFVADNPGMWMDHCHNLDHAARGMSMHLAYANVYTPYALGGDYGNYPE